MQRRNALKNIGLAVGAMGLSSTIVSIIQSCGSETDKEWKPKFLSVEEAEMVAKTLDEILPKSTDIPGATQLNLTQFIDGYLYAVSSSNEKENFKKGIKVYLDSTLAKTGKDAPSELTTSDITGQLDYYLKASPDRQYDWRQELWETKLGKGTSTSKDAMNFSILGDIRNRGIQAFKITEYIGENVLAYAPFPGEQQGCVDLQQTTQGKAWSL